MPSEPEQLFVADGVHAEQLSEAEDFFIAGLAGVEVELEALLFLALLGVVHFAINRPRLPAAANCNPWIFAGLRVLGRQALFSHRPHRSFLVPRCGTSPPKGAFQADQQTEPMKLVV